MQLMIRQEDLKLIIKTTENSGAKISPAEFEIEPLGMIGAIDEAGEKGIEVVGIFHSHPKCPPKPSGRDLSGMELWPVVWLIVGGKGNCGAYILKDGRVMKVCHDSSRSG